MEAHERATLFPLGGAAFVTTQEAAAYLGLCIRSIGNLVSEDKLRKVYPRPRSARITVESLTAYREAVEAGRFPPRWTQPGNPHTATPEPEPQAQPQKKGFLNRWLAGD